MKHWSRTCRAEPHLIKIYQEWKKRKDAEAHFIQISIGDDTAVSLPELPKTTEMIENSAMDVDPSDTAAKGDDGDINLDNDDLLGDLLGDEQLDMFGDMV